MAGSLKNFSNVFSRFGDLVLAFLVVAVIGLLIIPLPTPVVDLLISVNLMISTVMLMLSLYLPRALVAGNPASLRTPGGFSETARQTVRALRGRGTEAADRAAHEIENLLADADLLEHCRLALLET